MVSMEVDPLLDDRRDLAPAVAPALAPLLNPPRPATEVRAMLREHACLMFSFVGTPGVGCTSLLEATLRTLRERDVRPPHVAVIVGSLNAQGPHQKLARWCDQLVRIDTACLDARDVRDALSELDLDRLEWVFVEGARTASDGGGGDVGQNVTVGVFSVAAGDDKPAEQPRLLADADCVVLNQIDLAPYVPFSIDAFRLAVRRYNPEVDVLRLSALQGHGLSGWLHWLDRHRLTKPTAEPADRPEFRGEWFFG